VIDETLSPTWDETLVFDEILVYGTRDEIKKDPPVIIIEIFDQDKVVSITLKILKEAFFYLSVVKTSGARHSFFFYSKHQMLFEKFKGRVCRNIGGKL